MVGLDLGLAEMVRLPDLPIRAEIRLQPFSLAALHVWLRGVLHWEVPIEFSTWLHEETDGYPALLEAAVQQLAADGVLTRIPNGDGWQVSPFVHEYPLHAWLLRTRGREEEASAVVRPYGQLVGRSAELRTLKRALADQRVVVLAGHGGVGKTHLALQVAAELGLQFADGVIVVPLAAITEMEFVASALVRALGLVVAGRQEPQAVALDYLATRELLVVFDAVEHLPGIYALVQGLMAAPGVRVLITTRDATIVPADVVITLHGLRDERLSDHRETWTAPLAPSDIAHAEVAQASDARTERQTSGHPLTGAALLSALAERTLVAPSSALFLQASSLYGSSTPPEGESLAGDRAHLPPGARLSPGDQDAGKLDSLLW